MGEKNNVDPRLIDAVATQESGYGKASKNVMQVNGMDKSTPEQSMTKGAEMLGRLVNKHGLELGLASYNMGEGIVKFMKNNGITDVRKGMSQFSAFMKKKHGYKVYGDPKYLDHVLRYY